MTKYNPSKIEKKWQKYWEQEKMHETKDKVEGKENFYLLFEFPYPSGNLHIGHWYAFSVPDILSRYLRMKGFNVMYPIGFDAFGLPAENAAIERNLQPEDWTNQNITYMSKQLKSMGATLDWSREVRTTGPEYYKWTQWIFLQFYKKGLAYRAETSVNWCLKDKTVLANEQVINGRCERCGELVIQKKIAQWMFKITDYADKLIDDLEGLNWPQTAKLAQKNWVGRSEGATIKFKIKSKAKLEEVETFTTRPDTIFGTTFLVLAPEHRLIQELKSDIKNFAEVFAYVNKARQKSDFERGEIVKQKTGVKLDGIFGINPANNEKIPVYTADFVLGSYGTGAIMCVPAHDERDFEFAKTFKLDIVPVVEKSKTQSLEINPAKLDFLKVYTGDGKHINSDFLNGLDNISAIQKTNEWLESKKIGKRSKHYRLHDWVISRQRYWGVPIPMVHCEKCGYQPVSGEELPVKLPKLEDYKPTSDGRSPLVKVEKWVKTKCPDCGRKAERETDTMDTFVDSSWYFLRYTDPKNEKVFANKAKRKLWLPVDLYIGGAEHNTMHLLYSRFFTKALFDLGLIDFDEPFTVRKNHGVILGADSQKMSKSRGNVVDPDELVKKYGADAVRMYLAFMGPYDQGGPWNPGGMIGVYRFLNRAWMMAQALNGKEQPTGAGAKKLKTVLNRTIKKISKDISDLKFNTAVSELMKLLNKFEEIEVDVKNFEQFLKLLSPFAPHLAEEVWISMLGHKKSIHLEKWPDYNEKLIAEELVNIVVQVSGKARNVISLLADNSEEEVKKIALADEKVKKHLASRKIKRTIFIKNRLINFVV